MLTWHSIHAQSKWMVFVNRTVNHQGRKFISFICTQKSKPNMETCIAFMGCIISFCPECRSCSVHLENNRMPYHILCHFHLKLGMLWHGNKLHLIDKNIAQECVFFVLQLFKLRIFQFTSYDYIAYYVKAWQISKIICTQGQINLLKSNH